MAFYDACESRGNFKTQEKFFLLGKRHRAKKKEVGTTLSVIKGLMTLRCEMKCGPGRFEKQ